MHIYMYEGCHLTPRRRSQLADFGDYWQIFQRLRHNFEYPDCFSMSFPIWNPKHRL